MNSSNVPLGYITVWWRRYLVSKRSLEFRFIFIFYYSMFFLMETFEIHLRLLKFIYFNEYTALIQLKVDFHI